MSGHQKGFSRDDMQPAGNITQARCISAALLPYRSRPLILHVFDAICCISVGKTCVQPFLQLVILLQLLNCDFFKS